MGRSALGLRSGGRRSGQTSRQAEPERGFNVVHIVFHDVAQTTEQNVKNFPNNSLIRKRQSGRIKTVTKEKMTTSTSVGAGEI